VAGQPDAGGSLGEGVAGRVHGRGVHRQDDGRPAALARGGGVISLVGSMLVTILCHVPPINALAAVDLESAGGKTAWWRQVSGWTARSTVRTVAAIVVGCCSPWRSWPGGPNVASRSRTRRVSWSGGKKASIAAPVRSVWTTRLDPIGVQ
jgi:hypothetical protein